MTRRRKIFDAVCGIVIPIVFVLVDPAVFRSTDITGTTEGAFLGAFKAFSYTSLAIACVALATVLMRERAAAFTAGLLSCSAAVAIGIGLLLIPLSVLGIFFFGLGLLGFSPFVAAFVYARAARLPRRENSSDWKVVVGGFATFVLVATAAQISTNRAIDWAVTHPSHRLAQALVGAAPIVYDPDQLVWDYEDAKEASQKAQLASAYRAMTGKDITERLNAFAD